MDTQKTFILILSSIVAIAIALLIIQLLLKKVKQKADVNGSLNKSFTIHFSALFLTMSLMLVKTVSILSEAIDNIFKIKPASAIFEILKTASIYVGISFVWFLLWYYICGFLCLMTFGKRDDLIEIEKDNYTHFVIKSVVLFGTIFSLSPIFETILRVFIPSIQIPFYH